MEVDRKMNLAFRNFGQPAPERDGLEEEEQQNQQRRRLFAITAPFGAHAAKDTKKPSASHK